MKSVLILTASFGEGHNAAARNLREALLAASPNATISVHDVFLEAYGVFNRLMQKGYLVMINHFPRIWQGLFTLLDRTQVLEFHIGHYGAAARRLSKLIDELKPGVIVSTYPGCNHLLDHIYRRKLVRPFTTVTIITDSLTINSVWLRPHSDYLLVANQPTADVIEKAGVPPAKTRVPGFPVPRVFAALSQGPKHPPLDAPWKVLFVINSGHHVAAAIVRRLLLIPHIELTVTVGRNASLGEEIQAVARTLGKSVTLYGWTPDMPRLMAESHLLISKAGGATVQEALAARTPMIITQVIPGQEEGNARLILDNAAGAFASTPDQIAGCVENAIRNDGALWKQWMASIDPLSTPAASDHIAKFVLSLES